MSGGRVYGGAAVTTAVCRVALLGLVLVLIVIAYFPFAWSTPRTSYLYLVDHIEPFPPGRDQWLTAFLHMLSFILLGFLIVLARRPPMRPFPATLLAAALAVALAAGKFLFHGRHASVLDIVMEAAGGLLGALLAWRLAHARRSTAWPRAVDENARPEA